MHRQRTRLIALTQLGLLYGSRSAGVIVAFLFIPIFSRLLSLEDFGFVATIISLQALLVALDFGISTVIGRDVATRANGVALLARAGELLLSGFYGALAVVFILFLFSGGYASLALKVLGSLLLIYFMVMQNLYNSVLLAAKEFVSASVAQVIGVLTRAAVTVYALLTFSPTLETFLAAQALVAGLHALSTRVLAFRYLSRQTFSSASQSGPWLLLKRAWPLLIFSAAGAAVMQLDKPLITMYVSASAAAPYFLATTLCMTPISLLAGPVAQYFQPSLIHAITGGDGYAVRQLIRRFVASLMMAVIIPSVIFWFFRSSLIDLWLGGGELNESVKRYVGIMLPGFVLGAFGYIPYAILVAVQDFGFQSRVSALLTVVTLSASAVAAINGSVLAVCLTYVFYHSASTILSWLRVRRLNATRDLTVLSPLWLVSASGALLFLGIMLVYGLKV